MNRNFARFVVRFLGVCAAFSLIGLLSGCFGHNGIWGNFGDENATAVGSGNNFVTGKVVSTGVAIEAAAIKANVLAQTTPIESAEVLIDDQPEIHTFSKSDGTFTLGPVPNRVIRVVARLKSKDGKTYKQISSNLVEPSQNKNADAGILEVQEANLQTRGRLLDENGNPRPFVKMVLWGEVFTTDANGEYTTPLMPGKSTGLITFVNNPFKQGQLPPISFNFSPKDVPPFIETFVIGKTGANLPPEVSLQASAYTVLPGAQVTLTATAKDPEGQTLKYFWNASTGAGSIVIGSDKLSAVWTAPTTSSVATITFIAADSEGLSGNYSVVLSVGTSSGGTTPAPQTSQPTDLVKGRPISGIGLDSQLTIPFPQVVQAGGGTITIRRSDGPFLKPFPHLIRARLSSTERESALTRQLPLKKTPTIT